MRYGAKFLHLITRQKKYLAASELKAMNAQVCYSFTQYYFFQQFDLLTGYWALVMVMGHWTTLSFWKSFKNSVLVY